jgi:hypothetical protein
MSICSINLQQKNPEATLNQRCHFGEYRSLFRWLDDTPPAALSWCVFASLVVWSALSCAIGTFYDDEIFSLRWIAVPFPSLIAFIKSINSYDIHPPLSYVLEKLSFEALGNWNAVKALNGVVNAAAIAWFHYQVIGRVAERERWLLTFALATAATSEMWGSGLRWNAYFNPVFLILYTVTLSNQLSLVARTIVLTMGTVILFHTSYATVVAAPVLWATFLSTSIEALQPRVLVRLAPIIGVGVIACLPQLYILLTVHYQQHEALLIGKALFWTAFIKAIPQSFATLTVGNAVFPIDYVPCLFLLLLAAATISAAATLLRDAFGALLLCGTLLGFLLLVITGLGAIGRTAAFLYPLSLTLAVLAIARSAKWIRLPATFGFILLQMMSVYGFVLHRDTAKGSFNTPFPQAMQDISHLTSACVGKTFVFTHDPVLSYLVEQTGGLVSSPYASGPTDTHFVQGDCILIVRTYNGVLAGPLAAAYAKPMSVTDFHLNQTINLGYDRFHAIKTRVGHEEFPEYYVTIDAYGVTHDSSLPDWYGLFHPFTGPNNDPF